MYFVEHVLAAMNPKMEFSRRSKSEKISQMFTVYDEAWGVVLLLNEYKVWEYDWQKNNGNNVIDASGEVTTRPAKKYTSQKTGKGWTAHGRTVFRSIVQQVQARRANEASKTWEKEYMLERLTMNAPRSESTEESVEPGRDYDDDELFEMENEAFATPPFHQPYPQRE